MKSKVFVMTPLVLALLANVASAQSVSGLSVVKPVAPDAQKLTMAVPETVTTPAQLNELVDRYLTERKQLKEMLEALGFSVDVEASDASERAALQDVLRAQIRAKNADCKKQPTSSECKGWRDLRDRYRQLQNPATAINLAVPAGATAAIGDKDTATAGPVVGFQAWRPDDFFAGAFFTFDAAESLNGDGRSAGAFLRNPPARGTSFYGAASKMLFAVNQDSTLGWVTRAQTDRGRQILFAGLSIRAGITNATVEGTLDGEVISRDAFVLHATPALLFTSRTFRAASGGEYQFGMELGWAVRWIGGDAAQDDDFLTLPDVLGSDDTTRRGFDGTFFVRLNAFQPFVRLTCFGKSDGQHLKAFSGPQAFFGVSLQSSIFQTAR